jgi:hypothetical protein
MALLRTGDLASATETLTALDRRTARGMPTLRAKIASQLAVLYALRGEPAPADRWIAETKARLKGTGNEQRIDGALVFTQLVNGIRRDDEETALESLAAAWETLEGTLPTAELRPFRVLRAFATARRRPPETLAADPSVRGAFEGVRPRELSWLGVDWPEMHAFLDDAARGA